MLLVKTGNYIAAALSIFLLAAQFAVVQARVLPYLRSTFGSSSPLYLTFLVFGFPLGLLVLDGLMFLEPFGLLAVLPFPTWLKQFVPACALSLSPSEHCSRSCHRDTPPHTLRALSSSREQALAMPMHLALLSPLVPALFSPNRSSPVCTGVT